MQAWLAIALAIEVVSLIASGSAIQRDKDDTKAYIIFCVDAINAFIILALLIYYLTTIYPVISGR